MATAFEFKQGYALFQAEYNRPALDALNPSIQVLVEQLLARFAPYGTKFADLKLDQADGDLGRANLHCPLVNFSTTLRVFVERVEIETFYLERVRLETFRSLAVDAAAALQAARNGEGFRTYTFEVNVHGSLQGTTGSDFIGALSPFRPQHRGEQKGGALLAYFGQTDEQLVALLGADMSGAVKDGLFVRSRATWDASSLKPDSLPDLSIRELDAVFAALGLSWDSK